jgi:hypothetical protein
MAGLRLRLLPALLLLASIDLGCAGRASRCGVAKPNPYATVIGKQRRQPDASCRVCPPPEPLGQCGSVVLTELAEAPLSTQVGREVSVQGYPQAREGCTEVGCGCACCNDCDGELALSKVQPGRGGQPHLPGDSAVVLIDGALCHGDDESSCCAAPRGRLVVATGQLARLAPGGLWGDGFILYGASLCTP